jgi:hypothetical protein
MEQLAIPFGQRQCSRAVAFRGTRLGAAELASIRDLISSLGAVSVGEVVAAVCRRFGWLRPNGEPAIASCTILLRRLERLGQLRLPQLPRPQRATGRRHQGEDDAEILRALGPVPGLVECQPEGPLTVRPIAEEERAGFRLHMQRYHYLGFERSVGESLCYAALLGDELVALLDWGAAVLHNGPRDRWLGWDRESKARRLPWVVNNRRFLILPWIRQPHLASRVLGANLRRLSRDWQAAYAHPVVLAETFVDTARFKGTCYRASNWLYLGQTRGFSRSRVGFAANDRPKAVFVYELARPGVRWLREGEGG